MAPTPAKDMPYRKETRHGNKKVVKTHLGAKPACSIKNPAQYYNDTNDTVCRSMDRRYHVPMVYQQIKIDSKTNAHDGKSQLPNNIDKMSINSVKQHTNRNESSHAGYNGSTGELLTPNFQYQSIKSGSRPRIFSNKVGAV